ncbi:MAG: hypothetical protein U9M95_04935 [Candidatus Altiarchaeota archaeon]|nr:hypothetical protein [Candidatus Altiarchaeota archaeon]
MIKEEILSDILLNLARLNKWGNSHTSFDNLSKGFPKHIRGDIKKVGKYAIKEGYLISKPTNYGVEVSLNPQRGDEIKEIIRKYHGDVFSYK